MTSNAIAALGWVWLLLTRWGVVCRGRGRPTPGLEWWQGPGCPLRPVTSALHFSSLAAAFEAWSQVRWERPEPRCPLPTPRSSPQALEEGISP